MGFAIFNKMTPKEIVSDYKDKFKIIFTKQVRGLSTPLSLHPDMQIAQIGKNVFVCEPSVFKYYSERLKEFDVRVICGSTHLKSNYPSDIAYNVARVGNKLLCFEKYTDAKILENFDGRNVNIKQGYAKCNICIVGENSVITSDEGIYSACIENSIDALKISKGNIDLKPFEYGFIGGASFFEGNGTVSFFGNLKMHPDYEKILNFCLERKVSIKIFGNQPLSDLGGAIVYW